MAQWSRSTPICTRAECRICEHLSAVRARFVVRYSKPRGAGAPRHRGASSARPRQKATSGSSGPKSAVKSAHDLLRRVDPCESTNVNRQWPGQCAGGNVKVLLMNSWGEKVSESVLLA